MKVLQINKNDTMCDCNLEFTSKTLRKVMRETSKVKKIQHLYTWPYENNEILCYGCVDGNAGSENKHDLPGSGKKELSSLDNSDTQLLYNDIYLVMKHGKKFLDFDTSEYGLFYTLCFEGFDECNSSDETDEPEESDTGEMDDFIVCDGDTVENSDTDGEYVPSDNSIDSDDELEEDYTDY